MDEPECPGPDCLACNGAACELCGAGCWNNAAPKCEHSVDERHMTMKAPDGTPMEELLADVSHVYTREQFNADYDRVVQAICDKRGIAHADVEAKGISMGNKRESAITYADLKAKLNEMTTEQLVQPVVWTGDERGGYVDSIWEAPEDWIGDRSDHETWMPRSQAAKDYPDEYAEWDVCIPMGTVHLVVE